MSPPDAPLPPDPGIDPAPAAKPAGPARPMRGRAGPADAAGLLRTVLAAGSTGTLAVRGEEGVRFTLMEDGTSVARSALDTPPPDDVPDLPFTFHPHVLPNGALHGVPELPSRLPEAAHPALQSWPDLPGAEEVPPGRTSLAELLQNLGRHGFSGVLGGDTPEGGAIAVLEQGRLVAAVAERGDRTLHRGDALRLLARHASEPEGCALTVTPLPVLLRRGLLGIATDLRGDAPDGVRVGESGAVMLQGGVPALRVAFAARERIGRFRAVPDPAKLPVLNLPEDPPGWENRTYHLTLRGRDALDPMTELSMQFDAEVGASGKQILKIVRQGHPVATMAEKLDLELDQLGAWLRRLEAEGLIRGDG